MAVTLAASAALPAAGQADEPHEPHEPRWASFAAMHAFHTTAFARRPGFGPSRLVAPSRLMQSPAPAEQPQERRQALAALRVRDRPYRLTGQDLIGLQRDAPIVFHATESGVLRSEAIESYKTRQLTEFEKRAIRSLKAGRSVTYRATKDNARFTVVGALRAEKTCARCHDVPEKTLLGAFVYTLERMGEAATPSVNQTQLANRSVRQ